MRDTRDLRGTVGALIFVVVGGVCWWDISRTPSPQATVFPETVIGLMVVFSALLILRNLLGYAAPASIGSAGSVVRRVLLIVVMVIATLAMPYFGFPIAALAAYVAIMAIAMYERWTPMRLWLYPASGVIVVLGFYFIFKYLFQVPLPEPSLFGPLF
ncbi:tripartite tricarboxylate transporter TctB family protein [Salinisphaera sp. RV14]|uniref:tripartite tricarboxylate transporter TctB family protein n=1 Tax=unclassified Salinisphaera TaxID=2649847 RepID=UPI003F8780AC